ncbi:Phosphotransferase enzyme family protein [Pseudodesulfovibrio hydrargyri]|uniref:Phosphotransferase enzyme family protein n=1 Tax=Pseudodesulfovibrio hydrargyri TaxID=2125990 RepID=A0A1J5N7R6_9BACT|nr:aminoglycoside phosphotransferase family protein [Pseudodesulfovibrio hydrargyri]OIQ51675.1 Phosphotransferase enzyme family protein [Pseudodesulfovibrio hydrargyri]
MIELKVQAIETYLRRVYGDGVRLLGAGDIGSLNAQGMKGFGYGKPLLVRFQVGSEVREAVFSVMKGDKYGHQFYWDRAAILMFQYETSARMPRHVHPLGFGYVDGADALIPVRDPKEFFIVNEKLEGHDYFLDLERIRKSELLDRDLETAREFARWLAGVHAEKLEDPPLYSRRIRNLLGASECILGLVDEAFPRDYAFFGPDRFKTLEKRLIDWRWKLKGYAHRLSAVHGDFHPWNVLVSDDGDFSVLDRSRGEWGEPGGDLASMAVNYLLWALYDHEKLAGPFRELYLAYFSEYLERTGDTEVLEVLAPFCVFRGLVIASPEWYPDHPDPVRRRLFNFVSNVLEDQVFDWEHVNRYLE